MVVKKRTRQARVGLPDMPSSPKRTIEWKFKCKNCGYSFKASDHRKELYDRYARCLMCNSKNFTKTMIEGGDK